MTRFITYGDSNQTRGGLLSIGNFDGVHRGHQAILRRLISRARKKSVPAIVLTFEPHPLTLLRPNFHLPRLTTAKQKAELLLATGVDAVFEYQTDWSLLDLSPQEFFDQFILQEFNVQGLVEGPNFHFGRNREGTPEILARLCQESQRELEIVEPLTLNDRIVSSSEIRAAIKQGNLEVANEFLGRHYSAQGIVTAGVQRGRALGFPTANLDGIETLLPADGVYAAWCLTNGNRYRSAVSIGPNPTFSESARKVEAHLLDFTGDLYGQPAELRFVRQIRPLRSFATPEELQSQIHQDVETAKEILLAGGERG